MSRTQTKPKVYLSVPNGDGYLHKHVHFAVIKCLQDTRFAVYHDAPTNRPYENNLNHCAQHVLDGDFDYWLSIDSDNPPRNNPLDLIELGVDWVGLPTPVWYCENDGSRPYYFNVMQWDSGAEAWRPWIDQLGNSPVGLQEVDATGTGCFLVSRTILEEVWRRHPFARVYHPNGTVHRGHDYEFCNRIREHGFKVHTHFDYPCRHFVPVELSEAIEALNSMRVSDG